MAMIERHNPKERAVHSIHAIGFIILLLTGIGLYSKSFFGITKIFGGVDWSRFFHHWVGVVFIITVFLIYFQWKDEAAAFDEDDKEWFRVFGGYLGKGIKAPPSGKFNAGQKIFFKMIFWAGILFGITGIIMWIPQILSIPKFIVQLTYILHDMILIGLVMGVLAHVYLGTLANPGTISSLLTGQVDEQWARHHHEKWYKQMSKKGR
ncbi:MAG: formate dehydrogenase subunit gamma [Nitrospirota bacterium]